MNSTRKLMSLAALVLLGATTAANAAGANTAEMSFTVTQADEWNLAWKPASTKLSPGQTTQPMVVGSLDITRVAGQGARAELTLTHQPDLGDHTAFGWINKQTGGMVTGAVVTANAAKVPDALVIGSSAGGTAPIETGNTVSVQMQVDNGVNLEPGIYSATATVATYKE